MHLSSITVKARARFVFEGSMEDPPRISSNEFEFCVWHEPIKRRIVIKRKLLILIYFFFTTALIFTVSSTPTPI